MTELSLTIRHEHPHDAHAIEKLHERAFGPGRFARTAYRLREGVPHEADLSFTALVGTLVVASIRLSRIVAGGVPALLLGPVTVDPAFERRGIGKALVTRAIAAAREAGHGLVVLVGDEPYYGRVGFRCVPRGQLTMPGPVDENRLLYLELVEGTLARALGPITRATGTP
jgi:predicted N-acetyltransferase YhbS